HDAVSRHGIERHQRTEEAERRLRFRSARRSVDRVIHLTQVDPAHDRTALANDLPDTPRRGGTAFEKPQDGPGVETEGLLTDTVSVRARADGRLAARPRVCVL